MKILYIYSDIKCSCTIKCTFEVKKGFDEINHPIDTLFYTDLKEEHFSRYQVIVFQRLGGNMGKIEPSYLQNIHTWVYKYKGKTLTVYTIDDLLQNEKIFSFIKLVDLVLVPNEIYKKYYGKYNNNFAYFKTFIDQINFKNRIKKKTSKTKIIWASTALVGKGFMDKLIPEILENIPNSEINIYGYFKADYSYLGEYLSERVLKHKMLPLDEFVEKFQESDIILNPISTEKYSEDFLNCKSEIKYLNAALAKTPIITSKSYSYSRAIKNKVNGFILDNDVNLWVGAIKELISSDSLRDKIVKNAYSDVTQNYSLKITATKLLDIYKKEYLKVVKNKKPILNKKFNLIEEIKEPGVDVYQVEGESVLGSLFHNRSVTQEFKCNEKRLTGIAFKAATYGRQNEGNVQISILKNVDDTNPLRSIELNIANLQDNEWVRIDFEPIEETKNKNYFLKIRGFKSSVSNSISVYFCPKTQSLGKLYINKNKFSGNLALKTYYKDERS